jgi:glycosyltransferase involved in cell wall biosynthesis
MAMNEFKPVLLVPHFNHVRQFESSLAGWLATGVPLLVVDDGSDETQYQKLRTLAERHELHLHRLPHNQGKGEAVMQGFTEARRLGFTHALQVDADGQHDPDDVSRFMDCARANPHWMIYGAPVFGPDVPAIRKYGRKVTDFVVMLETWSLGMRDSLCGFRVYPLAETTELLARGRRPGARMEFDAEILVLAHWSGLPIRFLDTKVRYPEQGVSHFRYFADNSRMIGMHARLLLRMILTSPWLLYRKLLGRAGAVA